jgi:hypothetical protein
MFVGRILWTGKQLLNRQRRSCPESRRLWDGGGKSTLFTLVLAYCCLHDTRRYALGLSGDQHVVGADRRAPPRPATALNLASLLCVFDGLKHRGSHACCPQMVDALLPVKLPGF